MSDKKILPAPPSMISKRVYLRPASAEDIANTHHWWLLSEPQSLIGGIAEIESAAAASEAFKKQTGSTGTFMAVRRNDNIPIARLWFDHVNLQNRSAHVMVVVDPDERRSGIGRDALLLLSRYLFEQRGLNRLWTIVSEANHTGAGFIEAAGFKREGKLRNYFFYDGDYHDGLLYSMLRFELVS
jgi:RimJ/RimL family protein N-acetyltransferase